MNKKSIRQTLQNLAIDNAEYAQFNAKIVATKQKVLGVRLPDLRKFAKSLAREIREFADAQNLLKTINDGIYEEVLLSGLTITYAQNLTADEKIKLTKIYLKKVDSWAQIDSFVQDLKKEKFAERIDKDLREKYWNFALENLHSDKEFIQRHGVMILFSNFINEEKISEVFAALREISVLKIAKNPRKNSAKISNNFDKKSSENSIENSTKNPEKYYVKMAAAWLYAEAAISFFDRTFDEMTNVKIDIWTRRKALTKMLESRRISAGQKLKIRKLRAQLSG